MSIGIKITLGVKKAMTKDKQWTKKRPGKIEDGDNHKVKGLKIVWNIM